MRIIEPQNSITIEGVTFNMPKDCYGIVSDIVEDGFITDSGCALVIVHQKECPSKYECNDYLEEELYGEYCSDAISIFKVTYLSESDWGRALDFSNETDIQDSSSTMYEDMLDTYAHKYEPECGENEDYCYETHPDKKHELPDRQVFYWFDCHDDIDVYPYFLILRLENIADKEHNLTRSIQIEAILPTDNWEKEYAFVMENIKVNGNCIFNKKELI